MRKRFDRSCAAGIFLAVTLLFTFCAGTGSAEASHHIDLMAQAIAKYYEEEELVLPEQSLMTHINKIVESFQESIDDLDKHG